MNIKKHAIKPIFILILLTILFACSNPKRVVKVLVFSKTVGFRHGSIEKGIETLKKLGEANHFDVVATEDSTYFVEDSLKQFSAVIFLNTTGNVLNAEQKADFERYIQAGGGFVGVHAATDTEHDWPWYGKLVGAYFLDHPAIQEANLKVKNKKHPSSSFLNDTWKFEDEWYNYKYVNPDINVLIELDEESYEGGKNPDMHPASWYHEYNGGRAFYTVLGHKAETFSDVTFQKHLLGGITYAIGEHKLDYSKSKTLRVPSETRFSKQVLDFNLNEPMELDEIPGQGILFVERRGMVKLYEFETLQTKTVGQIDVFYGNEDGLLGVAIDPNFKENNWIYLFYSPPTEEPLQHISRFELKNDSLNLASEKILLKVPTIRECCHSGGALEFGPNGNLFITLGDNTNPFESNGFAPIDEREGRALWDAQKSAANTNDLRGKILRIKPEANGSYSIPEGNLFPVGTPNTRPEIYVMGTRNPFRHAIDSKTGYLYWGDVGPDSGKDNPERGPKGIGEFNQAKQAGFYGWPYTRGNNQPYNDYNFATKTSGKKFDPKQIVNDSPNNTGIKNLPPIMESLIWYSYDRSEEFPWLGVGGVNPMAGPIFHASDYPNAINNFPEYFENKLFVYEWMRDWIYVVTLNDHYDYVKADPFMPSTEFSHPMDMLFGSDGYLYILEYGQKWNVQNLDARLSRISYIEGNRKPIAHITADKTYGSAPLTVNFSSLQSVDYDNDKLTYEWAFTNGDTQSTMANPSFTFNEAGSYTVRLKIMDSEGASAFAETKILVGNDPPELAITINPNDSTYSSTKKINYSVYVNDKQDGNSKTGGIRAEQVKVTFDYIPQGKDMVKATLGHQNNVVPEGRKLIDGSDCKACHAENEKVNGPSYIEIAERYTSKHVGYLVSKIIKGGTGVWGETLMSAHPQLSPNETEKMVKYILSLKPNKGKPQKNLPLQGVIEFKEHIGEDNQGVYVLMASYQDQGNSKLADSQLSAQAQVIFKAPKIEVEDAIEKSEGLGIWDAEGETLVGSIQHGSYLKLSAINLKNLKMVKFSAFFGSNYNYKGDMEIREGTLNGPVIGKTHISYFNNDKAAMKYFDIPLQPKSSHNELFLVFKNTEDKEQYIANANSLMLYYRE